MSWTDFSVFTIANFHLPNQDQAHVCMKYLDAFKEGFTFRTGDFNLTLVLALDSSMGRSLILKSLHLKPGSLIFSWWI